MGGFFGVSPVVAAPAPAGPKIAYGLYVKGGPGLVFGVNIASIIDTGAPSYVVNFTTGYFTTTHIALAVLYRNGSNTSQSAPDSSAIASVNQATLKLPTTESFYVIAIGS